MRGKYSKKNMDDIEEVELQSDSEQPVEPSQPRPGLVQFTLWILYKNLYILGVSILRRGLRYRRRAKRFFIRCKGRGYAFAERVTKLLAFLYKSIGKRINAPFKNIVAVREEQRQVIRQAREQKKIPVTPYFKIFAAYTRLIRVCLVTAFNHIAPLLALWLFFFTISVYMIQPLGLAVEYNGEIIGYVQSEDEFEQATQILRSRFISTASNTFSLDIPRFTLVAVRPEDGFLRSTLSQRLMRIYQVGEGYTSVNELANQMVEASGNAIEYAYGLYVDERFYGAVTERGFITQELNKIRDESSTGLEGERVEFTKNIRLTAGLYPESSIVTTDRMHEIIHTYETVDQYYTVQQGDTWNSVSERTGVPPELLEEINPEASAYLQEGDLLLTSVARPFLSVQNVYTIVYEEDYPYNTVEVQNATYAMGYRVVDQFGEPGVREVVAEVTTINGVEIERNVVSTSIIKEPVNERIIVGTTMPTSFDGPASQTGFIWPTRGGVITVFVGGYPGHTGVDIPRDYGTPVYAAASGVVTTSRRTYTGYGFYVVIDHGDGFTTLYAHCSELYVNEGDQVGQGQVIGLVGRTGWATGNHLHFEVRQGGRTMQPQDFIGVSG